MRNRREMEKVRVALYARVSKDEARADGRFQDPENQLGPLRRHCQDFDWEIKGIFIDRASGGDRNRPEFQRMMGHVAQRHYDIILVWALDRFSREGISHTLAYIKQLQKYRTALKSIQESWLDTTSEGVGQLLLAILAWVAEEERKRISQRTKAGLAKLKAQGVKLGRPWHKIKGSPEMAIKTKQIPT